MDLFFLSILLLMISKGGSGATFTFVNNCEYTVWPGILANSGTQKLETTGFVLEKGTSRSLQAPTGWSGRFWGRTSCNFQDSTEPGQGRCATGDCGSGEIECNGSGATPPATLAEFTLGSGSQDFYDVSLVDGYNLPMLVQPSASGSASVCAPTGCVADLNRQCPTELRVGEGQGQACRSACEAFGSPEYCCSGAYNTPTTCKPSVYSTMFKSFCPRSYSYAYDDATSTFTCTGADYILTFCPSYANSQKSSTDQTPRTTNGGSVATTVTGPQIGTEGGGATTGTDGGDGDGGGGGTTTVTGSQTGTEGGGGVMLADASWIAGLATGESSRRTISGSLLLSTALFLLSFHYH